MVNILVSRVCFCIHVDVDFDFLTKPLFIGYRIAQIRVIFSLPNHFTRYYWTDPSDRPVYFAYVQWFLELKADKTETHGLYSVTRSVDEKGEPLASIIPLNRVRRSVHLIPKFGSAPVRREWSKETCIEHCNTFYVNSFSDRHAYHTIV